MTLTFQRAQREQIKIKIAIAGPAGSGKSEGALAIARQLVGPTGRIAALDTENRALSLYADRYTFDVIDLAPPYESQFFAAAIEAAVAGAYDALVIDSLSHQWEGDGGILDRKQKKESALGSRANGFALWNEFKAEHREFIAKLVNAPIHVVACFRAREEYAQTEKNGKKSIEKLGMAPITGEGAEYEFRVVFALTMEHVALTSKDNTGLFDGKYTNLLKDNPGGRLAKWLAEGIAVPATTAAPATPPAARPAPTERVTSAPTAPVETAPSPAVGAGEPACPECGGAMWDNRTSKTNPKAPDYKCRGKACEGKFWPGAWPPKPAPTPADFAALVFPANAPAQLRDLRGTALGDCTTEQLTRALDFLRARGDPRGQKWIDAIGEVLEDRRARGDDGPAPAAPDLPRAGGAIGDLPDDPASGYATEQTAAPAADEQPALV